jgi:hypothetical protein
VLGRLFPTSDGWYEWRQEPPLPAGVLVRVAVVPDGRLVLTGLRVEGGPTAELLRSIPVGRIEAAANAQLTVVDDAVVPAGMARHRPSGTRVPRASELGWDTVDPGRARERPPMPPRLSRGAEPSAGRRGHPDAFYRNVAVAYLDLAQASSRPAAELAEANGVPSTTAHRWIKEARRRGYLPPGRPGKAG